MTTHTDETSLVRATIDVSVPPDRAFEVFTTGIDSWWTRAHHVQTGELKEMGVDPFVGGRMWEENDAGEVCTPGQGAHLESAPRIRVLLADRSRLGGAGPGRPREPGHRDLYPDRYRYRGHPDPRPVGCPRARLGIRPGRCWQRRWLACRTAPVRRRGLTRLVRSGAGVVPGAPVG